MDMGLGCSGNWQRMLTVPARIGRQLQAQAPLLTPRHRGEDQRLGIQEEEQEVLCL
jgi:hypothetical protein